MRYQTMENNNPTHVSSDVRHLEQRVQNTERAIINLNDKFDKMEANVSDKFEKLLHHADSSAEKLYNRFDQYKESKQISMPVIVSFFSILLALVGWVNHQYARTSINEIKHEYVYTMVNDVSKRVHIMETSRFTSEEGSQLDDRVTELEKVVSELKTKGDLYYTTPYTKHF